MRSSMSPSVTDFLRSSRTLEIWQGGDSVYPYKIRGRKAFQSKEDLFAGKVYSTDGLLN